MDMGIEDILALLMDGGIPGYAIRGQLGHELPDKRGALRLAQLARQRDAQLVENPSVLAHGPLAPVDPVARLAAILRHVPRKNEGGGIGPADIADVRAAGAGLVRGPADTFEVAAVDGHGPPPTRTQLVRHPPRPHGAACNRRPPRPAPVTAIAAIRTASMAARDRAISSSGQQPTQANGPVPSEARRDRPNPVLPT